ncbi:MAG: N-acetylmuramoyl-L-alanine amidase [Bacteroidota bacterium]
MREFLQALASAIALLFGDGPPPRPTQPLPLPPPKPEEDVDQAPPPTPPPTEGEPQDASEIDEDDIVIVDHENDPGTGEGGEEFEDNPAPPPTDRDPEDEIDEPPSTPPDQPTSPSHKPRYMWCLDAGHGSQSAGKRSPRLANGERFFEYEFNRDIVERIQERLMEIGVRHFVTVPEEDVGNFLKQRVKRANDLKSNLDKLFVSIHANAGPARSIDHWTSDSARGIETWHYHGSPLGRPMAAIFQRHLIEATGFRNRHIRSKIKEQFFILRATKMPAILTENGFYNNREEVKLLIRDDIRQDIADAHVSAILEIERNGLP